MQQHFYFLRNSAVLFVGLFLFTATILRGQTQYVGANNGDWATASNWNNGLPSAANAPTIGGGAIVCINGTLALNFPINNFGTIVNKGTATLTSNLIGGVLDNQASFTVAVGAQANVNAGFTNSGTFTNRGAVNINSVAGSNAALGTINNEGAWDQLSPFINNGILDCKAGVFSSPTTITNNKTLEIRSGATYKVDFGGSFVNATGSLINNAGSLTNLGSFTNNTTLNNTGTYTNNGTHDCFGILNNESGGQITSTATMNFTGRLNNKLGATTTSGFKFNVNAGGFVSNIGTFNNNNTVDVKLGGTFNNEATGIVNLGFGSGIVNGGYLKTLAGSKITGNGSITNNKKLESYGLIESNNGASIVNTDTLCNFGTIKNVNTVSNSKYWKNSGMLDNTSGGVITNTGNFENFKFATVANNYEIYNRAAATMTNNGTFANSIRLYNEGLFVNNAYLVTTGEIYNRAGGTLTNTEVIEIKEGAIINEGTINNQKLFFNNSCSVISNKATINNTGRLESWGIVFQRGTVTGTQIVSNAGHVQTSPTSAAPSICRDTVKTGVDPDGEAKVYGQNPLLPNLGIDACNGFQYFVDNTTRAVYPCSRVGQTLNVPFKLLTRTGDSLTCTIKVTVFDNVPPIITGCPKDVTIITGQNTATHTWTQPTAVDNCAGTPVFATTKASGSSFPLGLTEVIITAKDVSNVQAECRFKVNVQKVTPIGTCSATDNTGPSITNCPANRTLTTQNGAAVAVWNEPTVIDACLPILSCASANSGQRFPVGTTTVIYTATDSKNNASTCSFTVTVTGSGDPCATDNIPPVITNCSGNFFTTLNPAINGGVGVWATPAASDNCGAVTLTSNFQTGTIFPAGNTVVTYTAKDTKNNTSTCSFTINVAATNPCAGDVTPPTITCPANIALNTTSNAATATWTAPTVTDNCGTPSVNATHTPGQMFQVGVTNVTYAASDANGNRKTCTFTVTVNNACFSDTTAPVLANCPANQTLNATNGTATATWTAPTATDNCTLAGITSNYISGSAFIIGATPVTYTATDNSGNKSNCTFTITVNTAVDPCATDVTPPSFGTTCPTNKTLSSPTGACVVGNFVAPTATDNCSTPSVTTTHAPTFCFPVGVTTVAYTATDAKLNKATCTFTVTVTNTNPCLTDVTPPVLTACPANQTLTTTNNACKAATWTAPTATDNCGTPSVTSTQPSGFCFPVGITTVTYKATDAKGNTAMCSFSVTVTNTTVTQPPVSCAGNLNANFSFESDLVGYDNWGGTTVVADARSGAKAAKVGTAQGGFAYVYSAVIPNATYTFKSWNKLTGIVTWAGVGIVFYDANWVKLTANEVNTTVTSTTYAENTVVNKAPANAKYMHAYVWKSGATGCITSDDWCVTVQNPTTCASPIVGKCYRLVNKLSGKVLGLEALNSNNSTYINQYSYNATPNMQWKLSLNTDGSYKIINQFSNDILACHYTTDGTRAYQWDNVNNNAKYWTLENAGNCEYRIKNGFSGKYLDNISNGSAEGGHIGISMASGGADQVWRFEEVACAPNCFSIGSIAVERWNNTTPALTFPIALPTTAPTITNYQGNTQGPWNIGDNYMSRARGYICPQQTGSYQFNVTGDNNVELFVSTSSLSASMVRVASIHGWTGELEYTKFPSQTSAVITLQANQLYYFELRHSEAGGGDGWRLSWKTPSNASWTPIQSQFLARSCTNIFASTSNNVFTLEARADVNQARLQWVSNGGLKNDYYEVEHLNEAGDFEKIGTVNAATGKIEAEAFTFTDVNPLDGDNSYRIKTVDNTGSVKISDIKTITFAKTDGVRLFPNPAHDYVDVDLKKYNGLEVTITVYNQFGKLLQTAQIQKASSAPFRLEFGDVATGSYLIRLQAQGKREVMRKIQIAR
jgi:HYR domain/PA14 domain/Ricin-type beta-trefoil lectin domain-like/Secretion system C-terminal sorting domain